MVCKMIIVIVCILAMKEAELVHENELSELNQHYSNHQKHLQESLSAVKDELKTMKMRYQEAMKHKDKMREMAAHRSEIDAVKTLSYD